MIWLQVTLMVFGFSVLCWMFRGFEIDWDSMDREDEV